MTVKELIEKLDTVNKEAMVTIVYPIDYQSWSPYLRFWNEDETCEAIIEIYGS